MFRFAFMLATTGHAAAASASLRDPSSKSIDIRMAAPVPSLQAETAETHENMQKALGAFGVAVASHAKQDDVASYQSLVQSIAPNPIGSSQASSDAARALRAFGKFEPVAGLQGQEVDPIPQDPSWHCETDFSQACPMNFVPDTSGAGGASKCTPTSAYTGPCTSDVRSFDGLSDAAKQRWASLCLASWPCIQCTRDFSAACPKGWTEKSDGSKTCQAPASYSGPCDGEVAFEGFNAAMLSEWSSACGAYWECKTGGAMRGASSFASAVESRSEPVVNLRLSPPSDPLPQVSALIAKLEDTRLSRESSFEQSLQAAFDEALAKGRDRIRSAVAEHHAFKSVAMLSTEAVESGNFVLKTSAPKAPGAQVRSGIKQLENAMASQEAALVQQGCREMNLLVDIVASTLQRELRESDVSSTNFLAQDQSLNVRLVAADAYPSIADLVAEMEQRRAAAQADVRSSIAEKQLKLLQALNGFASTALSQAK